MPTRRSEDENAIRLGPIIDILPGTYSYTVVSDALLTKTVSVHPCPSKSSNNNAQLNHQPLAHRTTPPAQKEGKKAAIHDKSHFKH
jgi:hypothetical protein